MTGNFVTLYSGKCQKCASFGCRTCTGADECQSCLTGFALVGARCVCENAYFQHGSTCLLNCPDGYYKDIYLNKCVMCKQRSDYCSLCASPLQNSSSSNRCECPLAGYVLSESNECVQLTPMSCKLGQFFDNNTDVSCQECQNSRGDLVLAKLMYAEIKNKNVEEVTAKLLQESNFVYADLSQGCSYCHQSNQCDSCKDGFIAVTYTNIAQEAFTFCKCLGNTYLYEGKCISDCPIGFFKATTQYAQVCLKCDTGFNTCNNNGTNNYCQLGFVMNLDGKCECDNSRFLFEGSCFSACPNGTYSQGKNCLPCANGCEQCSDGSSCSVCPPGYILNTATKQCSCPTPYYFLQGLCLQSCPVSYFVNTTSASCESCDASCAACSSKDNCSSCAFGFFLEDAQCISVCLTGYYQSPLDLNCQKCYSRCASCTSYSVCQSCKAGSVLFKEESICLSTCPQSYIKDPATNTCLLQGICQSICKYCDVSNKCRECEYPYYIHLDACVDKCPTYFYEINVNRTCASCFEGCKVCNGPLESQCADKYLNGSTTDDPSDDEDIYADLTQGGYKKPKKSQEERYCHLSCDKCVGKEFTHCVTCPQNRILKPIEGKNYGECQCPDGYSDQLYQYCKEDDTDQKIDSAISGSVIACSVTAGVGLVGSGNPVILISFADSGQTLNYLQLINRKNAGTFDKTTKGFSKSHPSQLFGNPAKKWHSESEQTSQAALRALQSQTPANTTEVVTTGSGKLLTTGYTEYFLVNAFTLILFHFGAWALGLMAALLKKMCGGQLKKDSFAEKLYHCFHWNFLIIVILLTTSELTLLCFYQFQNMQWSTQLGTLSSLSAIATLLYFCALFLFIIYHSYKGTFQNSEAYKNSFAVIVWPFKYAKMKYRFLPLMYLLRKILSTAIIVYIWQKPELQALLTTLNYFAYWYYIFLFNPMRKELRFMKVLLVTVESEMMLLHIWYYITVVSSDPNSLASEVELTKWNLYIMMLLMATYVGFSIGMVAKVIYFFVRDRSKKKPTKLKMRPANDSTLKKMKKNKSGYTEGKLQNLEFSFDEKQAGKINIHDLQQQQVSDQKSSEDHQSDLNNQQNQKDYDSILPSDELND